MMIFGFVSFVVYGLLFVFMQNMIARRRRASSIRREMSLSGLLVLAVFVTFWPFSFILLKNEQPQPIAIGIGLLMTALGLFSMWSQYALGPNWVGGIGLHKRHRLIITGPYRFARHPLYTGMLVSTFGLGIASWNIVYAVLLMPFSISFCMRAPAEERLLQSKFRKQYPAYAARTGRFFPKFRK